ncbi:MAG: glycosyltransferase family 4 protein [Burkholderiales bacterium]
MRVAQVAPLVLPVPPGQYGGTERVIHNLCEALVSRGHEVTLFASGDSDTSARLAPAVPKALWKDAPIPDPIAPVLRMHAEVFRRAHEFDVIHTHTDYFAFPFARESMAPVLSTLHSRLDIPHYPEMLQLFPEVHLVAISRSQQSQAPGANWAGTVHHGLAIDDYEFDPKGGEGLVFLGRLSAEKAPHSAIDVAVQAGVPLTVAGRVDRGEREYFEREVVPRLSHPLVRFVGQVGDREKQALLRNARALLFPIDWPEPFGLVMIEAMACGTPVIARPKGAAPEVLAHGVTGLLADSHDELVAAVAKVRSLDRAACRRRVEENFSVDAMADRYECIYSEVASRKRLMGLRRFRRAT